MHIRRGRRTIAGACATILLAVAACSSGDNTGVADDIADDSVEPSPAAEGAIDETDVATHPSEDAPTSDVPVSTTIPGLTGPATASPRAEVVSFRIDPDTDELIEATETAPGPATWSEVVDAGVAAGLWDELEGVTRMLGTRSGRFHSTRCPAPIR